MSDSALWVIAERLGELTNKVDELTNKVDELTDMLRGKLGGWDMDNLNVTLYTDKPITTTNEKGDK